MTYEDLFARPGSKGQRREARRDVRSVLGTSRDAAPDAHSAMSAVRHLAEIVDLATSGRFRVIVLNGHGERVTVPEALDRLKAGRDAGTGRI